MSTRKKHNRAPKSGSMSINPSGSVRAQFVLSGGKRTTRSFATKREAEAWLREMSNQEEAGLTTENYDYRVADFVQDWLKRKKPQIRPSTFADYQSYCKKFIIPVLGKLKIRDVKLQTVNKFYAGMTEQGRPVYVVRYTHRILHAMFEDAIRLGYIPQNPAHYADIPVPEEDGARMTIFSRSEHQKFMEACADALHGNLYKLAIKTGMRQGELLGLTWKNVDFERGEIRITQQIPRHAENSKSFCFAPLKTKHSRRTIQIGSDLVELLKAHYQARQLHKQLMGSRWKENDLVFSSSIGTPLERRNMMRDFDAMLNRAGLQKIRFHDLRHNAASMMLAGNISIVSVSRYLGHSSPQVTLEVYAHLVPGGFGEIVATMDTLSLANA